MKQVILSSPYGKHAKGETVSVADGIADTIVSSRRGVYADALKCENKSMVGNRSARVKRK